MDVTRELSTRFPSRHVSHMDLEGATAYLYGVLSALADEANEQDADHDVRVFVEQVTGANGRQVMIFFFASLEVAGVAEGSRDRGIEG